MADFKVKIGEDEFLVRGVESEQEAVAAAQQQLASEQQPAPAQPQQAPGPNAAALGQTSGAPDEGSVGPAAAATAKMRMLASIPEGVGNVVHGVRDLSLLTADALVSPERFPGVQAQINREREGLEQARAEQAQFFNEARAKFFPGGDAGVKIGQFLGEAVGFLPLNFIAKGRTFTRALTANTAGGAFAGAVLGANDAETLSDLAGDMTVGGAFGMGATFALSSLAGVRSWVGRQWERAQHQRLAQEAVKLEQRIQEMTGNPEFSFSLAQIAGDNPWLVSAERGAAGTAALRKQNQNLQTLVDFMERRYTRTVTRGGRQVQERLSPDQVVTDLAAAMKQSAQQMRSIAQRNYGRATQHVMATAGDDIAMDGQRYLRALRDMAEEMTDELAIGGTVPPGLARHISTVDQLVEPFAVVKNADDTFAVVNKATGDQITRGSVTRAADRPRGVDFAVEPPARPNDTTLIRATDAKGGTVGNLELASSGDTLRVVNADVAEAARGTGIGNALYDDAARLARQQGKTLVSDTVVSEDATRVWESLARRGYKIVDQRKTNPSNVEVSTRVRRDPSGKVRDVRTFETKNGTPLISIEPPAGQPTPFRTAREAEEFARIQNEVQGGLTPRQIERILKEHNKVLAGNANFFDNAQYGSIEGAVKYVNSELLNSLRGLSNSSVKALTQARNAYKVDMTKIAQLKNSALGKILGQNDEQVMQTLANPGQALDQLLALDDPAALRRTRGILEEISPQLLDDMKVVVLERALQSSRNPALPRAQIETQLTSLADALQGAGRAERAGRLGFGLFSPAEQQQLINTGKALRTLATTNFGDIAQNRQFSAVAADTGINIVSRSAEFMSRFLVRLGTKSSTLEHLLVDPKARQALITIAEKGPGTKATQAAVAYLAFSAGAEEARQDTQERQQILEQQSNRLPGDF